MKDLTETVKAENTQKQTETIKRKINMPIYYIW